MRAAAERAATIASTAAVVFVLQCRVLRFRISCLYEKYLRGIRSSTFPGAACETFELGAPMAANSMPNNESIIEVNSLSGHLALHIFPHDCL